LIWNRIQSDIDRKKIQAPEQHNKKQYQETMKKSSEVPLRKKKTGRLKRNIIETLRHLEDLETVSDADGYRNISR
jgi:hypothetical protein